jgi:transcriptional regulator with XRE-family HTH domain
MGRQNGAAIRAFRNKEGLSVVKVAGLLQIHPQALRNIENGTRPAGSEVMWHLARILDVPLKAITRDGTGDGAEDEGVEDEVAEPNGAAA